MAKKAKASPRVVIRVLPHQTGVGGPCALREGLRWRVEITYPNDAVRASVEKWLKGSAIYETKNVARSEARADGRTAWMHKHPAQVFIHNADGRIAKKGEHTYGRDPERTPG
jgi:hypothetical protein